MRRVHHNGIHPSFHQSRHALLSALAHAHCRAHAQLALFVSRGVREAGLLGDVFHRDQALQAEFIIHHQQTLQAMFIEQRFRLFQRRAHRHSHQFVAKRHDGAHGHIHARLKAQITARDDAHHFAAIHHGEAAHSQLLRQLNHLMHLKVRRDHHWIAQHAAFMALNFSHLRGLLFRREILVNDAHSALLRHRNGQARLGHGVHCSGNQRQIQRNSARKLGLKRCVFGQDGGERRDEQNVVKCEGFAKQAHVEGSKNKILRKHSCCFVYQTADLCTQTALHTLACQPLIATLTS